MKKELEEQLKQEVNYIKQGEKSCRTCINSKREYGCGDMGDRGYLICKIMLDANVDDTGICDKFTEQATKSS